MDVIDFAAPGYHLGCLGSFLGVPWGHFGDPWINFIESHGIRMDVTDLAAPGYHLGCLGSFLGVPRINLKAAASAADLLESMFRCLDTRMHSIPLIWN